MTPDISVSLETHLIEALTPIYPLLPADIADEAKPYVTQPQPALVPYNVLFKISQWARSAEAEKTLEASSLKPQDYSMIALLAGTTTSPERQFGDYKPPKEQEEIEADRVRERKAITSLVNAVLSVLGVGFGAYWAADKTGWKNEWRVLFALFAAIVVAVAEAGLYIIWQSRRSTNPKAKKRSARHKKVDPVAEVTLVSTAERPTSDETTSLRHRR